MEQRFWVAKPIYKPKAFGVGEPCEQISIGFSPKADYWTVAGDFAPADCFSVGIPNGSENKTILSGLRLNHEEASQLADLFEKERLASIADKRPAYYQRILTWFKGSL